MGFELGADDYVVRPFSVRELVLRMQAVMRRADTVLLERHRLPGRSGSIATAHRACGHERRDQPPALEFKLPSSPSTTGRTGSRRRSSLLSDVWGIEADIETRTVDTHVKRLREKLGAAGQYIETVRGVGYRFSEQPSAD